MSVETVTTQDNKQDTRETNVGQRPEPLKSDVFMVKFKEVLIEGRHRKEYGDLLEFSRDINQHGLLNPIVVRPLAEPKDGLLYQLVAGERRTRAMLILGWSQCPATLREDFGGNDLLAVLKAKEAELSENVARKSNTMMEQAELVKKINDIKVKLHGEGGKGQGSAGWNIEKTAAFVGKDSSLVSKQIRLIKHVEKHPEKKAALANLDINTAIRRIKQDEHAVRTAGQIDRGELEISGDVRLGDAVELIKALPSESQHLIITDPPFGLEEIQSTLGGTKGPSGTYTALLSESDNQTLFKVHTLMDTLIPEFFRVLKPSSHCYIFTSGELLLHLIPLMKKVGFELNENILIWDKKKTTTPFKGLEYPSAYEPIIFAHKPPREKHLLLPDCGNIIRFSSLHASKKIHRFQKPTDLVVHLLRNSSLPGNSVLDPFAGSGVVVRVAKELKRNALGFEIDKDNWARAQIVLTQGVVKAQEILCRD